MTESGKLLLQIIRSNLTLIGFGIKTPIVNPYICNVKPIHFSLLKINFPTTNNDFLIFFYYGFYHKNVMSFESMIINLLYRFYIIFGLMSVFYDMYMNRFVVIAIEMNLNPKKMNIVGILVFVANIIDHFGFAKHFG